MKILVIGIGEVPHLGNSFRVALTEAGHTVSFLDEREAFGWLDRHRTRSIVWRLTGGIPMGTARFNATLLDTVTRTKPDVLLSVKGPYIEPETLRKLRERTATKLVNFSPDDPFNPAASSRFLPGGLPYWHLYASPRPATFAQLRQACTGGEVVYLPFGYDPANHFPEVMTPEEERQFGADLAFIGVCDAARTPLLESLAVRPDINVAFYGGGRYPYNKILRPRYRGFANGRAYRLAIAGSKISLSLLRHTNHDTHVMRTFEIPACRAFMLAERTDEHLSMFEEGKEAEFFSTPEEMMDKIRYYLAHEDERLRVAEGGYQRTIRGGNTYKDRLFHLLSHLKS
jgi:hypothetical protein